jgi:hypothetical protein
MAVAAIVVLSQASAAQASSVSKRQRKPQSTSAIVVSCETARDSRLAEVVLVIEHGGSTGLQAIDSRVDADHPKTTPVSVTVEPVAGYTAEEARNSQSTRLIQSLTYAGTGVSLGVKLWRVAPGQGGEAYYGQEGESLLVCRFTQGIGAALK